MKITVGCPVMERAWCLPRWFESIERQGVEVDITCLYTASSDDTLAILNDHGVNVIHDEKQGRPIYENEMHTWGNPITYDYMANIRNALLDAVKATGADYFFSLDSDIVLPDGALERLLEVSQDHPGTISPAVNMLRAGTGFAWNVMSWVAPGVHAAAHRPPNPQPGDTDILMAAMLLDKTGMEARWQFHHQGEDLGYCADAANKGIKLWWVSDLICEHLMVKDA